LQGETTVTADSAPIRANYPDGGIVKVVSKGTTLRVSALAGDATGIWLNVTYHADKDDISGWIDNKFTTADKDLETGRLKSPK